MAIYDFKCLCGFEIPLPVDSLTKFTEAIRCPYCQELLEIDKSNLINPEFYVQINSRANEHATCTT